MSLAMLPLGLISVYQTQVVVDEAQALSRAALLAETVAAASGERELIQQALGAARGLSAAVDRVDSAACTRILSNFIDSQQLYIFASYVQADGRMDCSSSGETRDFGPTPTLQSAMERNGPAVEMLQSGPVTKQAVITASHPVRVDGQPIGIVSISIPHSLVNALMQNPVPTEELKLASVNTAGEVISSTSGIRAAAGFLPQNMELTDLVGRVGTTFSGVAGDGQERFFAVAPMIDDVLVLVGSWPVSVATSANEGTRAHLAVVFPALMWLAGIGVAFLGLQRLVVRHVRQLRSAMRQFALGERRQAPLMLANPPEELEEAQRAFNRMVLILTEAEARQEKDLHDKEVLLKEVHHRVKNNLQLIASIMNMQSRSARSTEAKHMLAGLQRRVRGLAMLHRTLYTTTDLTTVDSRDLIQTVVDDVSTMSRDGKVGLTSDIASVPLFPDQAVPLSMLVTEALTNAYKYVGTAPDGSRDISISLLEDGNGLVVLRVENTVGSNAERDGTDGEQGDGLGNRLMTAFVRQLDGEVTHSAEPDQYALAIEFPRRDFKPPEKVEDAA
ncbi:sensor histidine kinase [Sagittula sp. SSi028]|uniref:sensor histidine kinase n=1 Tax=Sagittula sp. SSi028 TaxID=3400636 RepID=UPI003AF62E49